MWKQSILLCFVIAGLSLAISSLDLPVALAQEPERVALVVQFDDEMILTSCIETKGQAVTGQELLQLSGLELVFFYDANQEVAVCKVNGQGCDANTCFCQFPDYWSYWHLQDGEWVYSGRGSSTYIVQPGAVEGWRWGDGAPPSKITYEQICSPDADNASLVSGLSIRGAETSDFASRLRVAPSRHSAPDYGQLGYLVFGLALVSMGFGLMVILRTSRS